MGFNGDLMEIPSGNLLHMGMSANGVNIPNEIAIFHRDNDQQNHWV